MARLLFIFTLLCGGGIAHAQGADESARAQELFEGAQAHIDAGEHELAIAMLEESMGILPHGPTAYSLGISQIGAGRAIAAEEVLTRLFAGEFGELPPELREDVSARLTEARAQAASLVLSVRGVDAANVRVDSEDWGQVRSTGLLTRRIDPGSHTIEASAEGHENRQATIVLGRGESVAHTIEFATAARLERGPNERPPVDVQADDDSDQPAEDGMSAGVVVVLISLAAVVLAGGVLVGILAAGGGGGTDAHPVFGRPEALISF